MKYEEQISQLKPVLQNTQSVLIVLPQTLTVDNLASGLSLALSIDASNKQSSVISSGDPLVSHSTLFGVGKVQKNLPSNGTGKFILTIGGVMDENNQPLLEKVDYSMDGDKLNLVFPIVSGKTFEPKEITPKFEGTNFELVFVVGVQSLEQLGEVYQKNQEVFSKAHLVNIDNNSGNSGFGTTKILDPEAGSLSEMLFQIIAGLGLEVNRDIAQNLLRGMTGDLGSVGEQTQQPAQLQSEDQPQTEQPQVEQSQTDSNIPSWAQTEPQIVESSSDQGSKFDFTQMYKPNPEPMNDNFTVPPVVDSGPGVEGTSEGEMQVEQSHSGLEAEVEPEDDWLTPKVFGGKSIG